MTKSKILIGSLVVILATLFIYSCANDVASYSDVGNQNVEFRSRCGDNYNVAPTPTIGILPSENGMC
jgi:hypothetical protein